MINLIPNEEKKKMSKDFYLRLLTLFFTMLGVSLLVASVAILPSYFLSSAEKSSIDMKLELQGNGSIALSDEDTQKVIEDLNKKLSLIENAKEKGPAFSQKVINEIILKKMSSIKITEILYQNDPQTGERINISGRAPNREVLLLFRRTLEDNTAFSKVDLPISNFVKGSNIKFYLNLVPS